LSAEEIINFIIAIRKLKDTERKGWVTRVNIANPESVADHSFLCAILAMCIGDSTGVDANKLLRMLLLHDIQESLTGDFDYKVKKELGAEQVKKQERDAIKKIFSCLPQKIGDTYKSIWNEYEEQKTPEAILANDIDKLELIAQALEYEDKGYMSKKFDVFWEYAKENIKTPTGQALLKSLFTLRRSRKKAQLTDYH